jgi:hypothetical protein
MIHICVVIASFVSPVGVALSGGQQQQRRTLPMAIDAAPTEYQEESAVDAARALLNRPFEREQLKGQLLRVCAACNRGFGASALDRASVDGILERLTPLSPTLDPTAGMVGSAANAWVGRGFEQRDLPNPEDPAVRPLNGNWRLVYTNATDVLSLDANPLAGVGPISQEISLPAKVVNVIDLYPRLASLLPPGALRTATRLRVSTRARARSATRVGLTFESVGVESQALLGLDLTSLLPTLSLPLPSLGGNAGADDAASGAYFDVGYLDDELLVILQNQPGGAFVLVRETSDEQRLRSGPAKAKAGA